ncbi:hypothetical protein Ga0100231_019945 [Opitutaceae bacterium TAV4]|nr:hypothetical protein Ga0100231_019945 [Opitutaceae bacterium TAV4]RRK00337.1 hypothetical protein Ga0100230_020715 [Opitutaceae bacterium TAV3]
MARLNRLHLTGLGLDSARFNPVTLDFRDATGAPTHTVMWLRNGGGKTTLLSFLYSTLLPHAHDWLGRHNGRQTDIYEYLRERQTGYILLEFDFPTLGTRRVIGQALRRNSSSSRDKTRIFFTFRTDGPLAWDAIPLTGLAPNPVTSLDHFLQHLQNLSENAKPDTIAFYKTTHQADWREHLESIGLDPEIYRTHLLMNADEGGLLKFFDFKTPETFVEKLLDMAYETPPPPENLADETQPADDISQTIDTFRQRSHARPDLNATATFCKTAIAALTAFKTELDIVAQHQRQRLAYRQRATRFLHAVTEHITRLQTDITAREAEMQISENAKRTATAEKQQNRTWQKTYERHQKLLTLAEAETALHDARRQLSEAKTWHAALTAAHRQKQIKTCETQIAQFLSQKQTIEQQHAPDRQLLERLGRSLLTLLKTRISQIEKSIADLSAEKKRLGEENTTLQNQKNQQTSDESAARTKLDANEEFFETLETERQRLQNDGILQAPSETGADAITRWGKVAEGHEKHSAQCAADIEKNETLIRERRVELNTKKDERQTTLSRLSELGAQLAQIDNQATQLRKDPEIIRELGDPTFDPTSTDPAKTLQALHNPALATTLQTRINEHHQALLAKNLEGAADRRIIGHCETHPGDTFPPPSGVENTLKKLRAENVTSALPAYQWLGQNCQISDALQHLANHPALYSGIIIQNPDQLKAARSLVATDATDLPILLATPDDIASPPPPHPHRHVILPEEKGFFNAETAKINLGRVRNRAGKNDEEIRQLYKDHRATTDTHARLADFIKNHPAAAVSEKRIEHQKLKDLETRQQQAIETLDNGITKLDEGTRKLREQKSHHDITARTLRNQQQQARNFVTSYEQKIPAKREEAAQLEAKLRILAQAQEKTRHSLQKIKDRVPQIDEAIIQKNSDLQKTDSQKRALPEQYIGLDPEPDAGDDIDSLYQRFNTLRQSYEQRVKADYYDGKIEGEQDKIDTLKTEQERDPVKPPQDDINLALQEPDLLRAIENQNKQVATADRTAAIRENEKNAAEKEAPPPLTRAQTLAEQFHPTLGKPKNSEQAKTNAQHCADAAQQSEASEQDADANLGRIRPILNDLKGKRGRYDQIPPILERLVDNEETEAPTNDFSDDDVADYEIAKTLANDYDTCQSDLGKAQEKAKEIYADHYLTLFNHPELIGRTINLVERFRIIPRAEIESRIEELITELRDHAASIDDELASFEGNRQNVLKLMDDCERQAASVLRAAVARSIMPENMDVWAGQHFLRINIPQKNDTAERRVLLDKTLSEWIDPKNPKTIPTGAKLAYHCLIAIAGRGQIDVKILKPEYTLRLGHHDILKLKNFSGGEQVTAAIILYCIIVKLRAQRRARATSLLEDSGFLLLDNPLGKANLPDFVDLQVNMATRMGVQYICGTGIDDFNALAGFPKIIRMRNTSINPDTGANIVEVVSTEEHQHDPNTLRVASFGKSMSPPPPTTHTGITDTDT